MEKTNNSGKIYFSFSFRLIAEIVLFIVFAFLGMFLIKRSLTINSEKYVNYKDQGSLDYKVKLLPNNFYEEEFMNKNMLYVASLIDQIIIDFDYNFESDETMNMDFSYEVNANLVITNKNGTKSFYEKEYSLIKSQNLQMNNSKIQKIKEEVKIDYSKYNNIANSFRTLYGVETESKLNVYMTIAKKNANYKVNENSKLNITIPLSQKAVEIQMKANDINSKNKVVRNSEMIINNNFIFGFALLSIVVSILLLVSLIKKLLLIGDKKSLYDKNLEKILREYDRLIAESSTLISFDEKNVVKIKKFTELLDIHDNLQLPIIHYAVTKHLKSYFYINHGDTIYLYVLKAIDLEVSKDEKKK